MDEAFWLVCNEPEPMLEYLIAKPSDRKLRLFAVAYYRHIGHLLTNTRSWEAVEFADQYADGRATTKQLDDHNWGTSKEPTYVVSPNAWEAAAATSAYGIQLVVQAMIASDQEARAVWESAFKQTVQQGKGLLEAKVAANTVAPAEWVARQQTAERDEWKRIPLPREPPGRRQANDRSAGSELRRNSRCSSSGFSNFPEAGPPPIRRTVR